jgi:hypothetical protein
MDGRAAAVPSLGTVTIGDTPAVVLIDPESARVLDAALDALGLHRHKPRTS